MPKRELILGEPLANGYILEAYDPDAKLVLAHSPRPNTPEPWVVWRLDRDNDTYGGRYFKYEETAKSSYYGLCAEIKYL